MPNFSEFDRTTKAQREARRARIVEIVQGERGDDGLTDGERELLAKCRAQGIDICGGWLEQPTGAPYFHSRTIVRERVHFS